MKKAGAPTTTTAHGMAAWIVQLARVLDKTMILSSEIRIISRHVTKVKKKKALSKTNREETPSKL